MNAIQRQCRWCSRRHAFLWFTFLVLSRLIRTVVYCCYYILRHHSLMTRTRFSCQVSFGIRLRLILRDMSTLDKKQHVLSLSLCLCLSVCLTHSLCLSVCLSLCLPLSLQSSLSLSLSLCLSVCLTAIFRCRRWEHYHFLITHQFGPEWAMSQRIVNRQQEHTGYIQMLLFLA